MVDQGHVVLFAKKRTFAYHPSDRVAIECVYRDNVYEVNSELESVNQRADFARQAQPWHCRSLHSLAMSVGRRARRQEVQTRKQLENVRLLH